MIQLSIENSSINTSTVFGDNPFPIDILNNFKDFEEGRVCQYLVKFKCDQAEVGNLYSTNYMFQEQLRILFSYPDVITETDSDLDLLYKYSNSNDHMKFINSFLIEDEVIDLYSSQANLIIGNISS